MEISEQDFKKYLTIDAGLAKKSISTYLIRFRIIGKWLQNNNLTLTKLSVRDFLYQKSEEEKLSNSAVNTYLNTLKHIDKCYEYYDLPSGFAKGRKGLPKVKSVINPLSLDETYRLLDTPLTYENRNGADCSDLDRSYLGLTRFLSATGSRFEECAYLTVDKLDIDGRRAMLVDTKNKEHRFIFYNGPVIEDLRYLTQNKNPGDLIFTNSVGGRIYAGDFNNNLRRRAKKIGITKHVHAHLLRHTYASQSYNDSHDIGMVATLLGHKDIQVTYDTYVHLDTESIQRAADRHPLLRKYLAVDDAVQMLRERLDNLKIGEDKRFDPHIIVNNEELVLRVKILR